MVPSIRTTAFDHYHASHNRSKDWQACCAKAMGYEDWALVDLIAGEDDEAGSPTEAAGSSNSLSYSANNNNNSMNHLQVTNLLPNELFEDDDDDDDVYDNDENAKETATANNNNNKRRALVDPWTENALNIQADLERMANWIQSKKMSFISFDAMRDDEASLIQSTVTSFAATTANEIESLRKMTLSATTTNNNNNANNNNELNHRMGIVQILFARLKEDIVEPFGILQKHRSRKAVSLWQNPLQCKLLVQRRNTNAAVKRKRGGDEIDQALGLVDDDDEDDDDGNNNGGGGGGEDEIEQSRREQRFLPLRDTHNNFRHHDFMETYQKDQDLQLLVKRPKSLIRDPLSVLSSKDDQVYDPNNKTKDPKGDNNKQQDNIHRIGGPISASFGSNDYYQNFTPQEEMSEAAHHQMQQEALLLETMVNSDLDSVQKMEQQMVSITTLLTQFSELVSEQQEEVWHIHDTAKETKANMDKGQETLVDAAEQTHQSKHYMAKGIFGLGCLLLLFHWLRP